MRKILTLFLAAVTICSLYTGCGTGTNSENNTENLNQSDKEQDTDNLNAGDAKKDDNSFPWEFQEVNTPSIEGTTIKEVSISESTQIKIAVTPFNYDIDTIKSILEQNEYISENYVLAKTKTETMKGETYTDIGNQAYYEYTDGVNGCAKKDASDTHKYFYNFSFKLSGNTSLYENYTGVSISFTDVDITKENQQQMYSVLEDTLGEEYAKVLIYGKDPDGADYNGGGLEEYDYAELITVGDTTYKVRRYFDIDSDPESSSVAFTIAVNDTGIYNTYEYYKGNYESAINEIPYNVKEVFGDRIGSTDLIEFNNFADSYMNVSGGEYSRTIFNNGYSCSYEIKEADNGVKTYEIDIDALKGCSDISKIISPTLSIQYEVTENNTGVIDTYINVEGTSGMISNYEDKDASFRELHAVMEQNIKMLLGEDVDLSAITYDKLESVSETKSSLTAKTIINLFGVEEEATINISIGENVADCWTGTFTISTPMF